ncbi:uncharacterized protein TNCV_3657501 [Trichonephila clavipes]|nr:uncharacterized protein TNCV_3657501 [Trichonephila clavipes]
MYTAVRDLSGDSPDFAIWYEGHKSECQINHTGSSSSMEMEAAAILWQRYIKECNMRYTCILSDGDSKTFQHLMSLNIYGKGTGLRSKVKEWRSKGVCIGGKKVGSLKETIIVKLTNFYRRAIKDNCNDIEKMKSAIYATLYHCSSTDAKPKHNKCPNGKLSWCFFFKRALANEESPESHSVMKTKLTEEVVAKILPVYQRLASNEILSRCTSGKSQNANESLHNVIWSHCPKESFQSKKRLEISVVTDVSEFNFGSMFTLKHVHQNASLPSMQISGVRDERRLKQSRRDKCAICPSAGLQVGNGNFQMVLDDGNDKILRKLVPFGSASHDSIFMANNVSESAMSRQHAAKLCPSFQSSRQDVKSRNMTRSGRSSFSTTEIIKTRIGEMIQNERRITLHRSWD